MEFLVMVAVVLVFICTFVKIAAAKDGTSLWTAEQIQNARENVKRYDWAKAELAVERRCEPWLAMSDEEIWNLITGQEVPRGIHVNANLGCPSCGRDVYAFGNYPWKVSFDTAEAFEVAARREGLKTVVCPT